MAIHMKLQILLYIEMITKNVILNKVKFPKVSRFIYYNKQILVYFFLFLIKL